MKNTEASKDKIISKYLERKSQPGLAKSTDINVLLNRVKTNQKNESRKKLYFSAELLQDYFVWIDYFLINNFYFSKIPISPSYSNPSKIVCFIMIFNISYSITNKYFFRK